MDDFEDFSSSDESDDSDSDASFHSISPVTSDNEYYTSSDSSMDSDDSGDDEEDSHVHGDDSRSFQSCGKDWLFIVWNYRHPEGKEIIVEPNNKTIVKLMAHPHL